MAFYGHDMDFSLSGIELYNLCGDYLSSVFPSLLLLLPSYQSSLDVLVLAGLAVLLLASPGLQCGGLQGPAEGEGEGPGPVQRAVVDGVEVDCGLLLALTARQEGHTWERTEGRSGRKKVKK